MVKYARCVNKTLSIWMDIEIDREKDGKMRDVQMCNFVCCMMGILQKYVDNGGFIAKVISVINESISLLYSVR